MVQQQEVSGPATSGSVSACFIGHFRSGKSTTLGHLLFKLGEVDTAQIQHLEKEGAQAGRADYKYAWVLDHLRSERERGMSINISTRKFQTAASKRQVTVIDTPGQQDFMKNLMSGLTQCDSSVVVVSAVPEEFEVGSPSYDQVRAICTVAFGFLSGKRMIVAINKMDDKAVDFSEKCFKDVVTKVDKILKKAGQKEALYVPISGWTGDNLVELSSSMPWYTGVTLQEALENIQPAWSAEKEAAPLRIPIQTVHKIGGVGTVVVGRVDSGCLRPGMRVHLAPANVSAEVLSIEMHHEAVQEAHVGDNVGFHIQQVSVKQLRRGMLCGEDSSHRPMQAARFKAQIIVVDHPNEIRPGYTPIIHCHTAHAACTFTKLLSKVDKRTGKEYDLEPKSIKTGDAALVLISPQRPICMERRQLYNHLGRIAIRDGHKVVAVGIVVDILTPDQDQSTWD